MNQIVELNEEGALYLTTEQLGNVGFHKRYILELDGELIVLRPVPESNPWNSTSALDRATRFREWGLSHKDGPGLTDDAISRESIYD